MTAPNTSIRELIQVNVESAVAGIAAAESGVSDYNYTVRTVERARIAPYDGPYPAVFIYDGGDTPVDELDYAMVWQMTLQLACWMKSTRSSGYATEINALIADVQKAVMADRQRNAKAIDTSLAGVPEIHISDDNLIGAVVTVTVKYHVKPSDPAAQT